MNIILENLGAGFKLEWKTTLSVHTKRMSNKGSKDDGKLKFFFFVEFMSFDLRNIQIY